MSVPGWWQTTLLSLATYRTWKLLAEDEILEPWRGRLLTRAPEKINTLIECAWCSGFWLAVLWYSLWWWEGQTVLAVASIFALSAATGLIAHVTS